jgi:type III secretion protein D
MTFNQRKLLRILSGRHAGGSLQLGVGEHTVGAGSDNDIIITDWTAPTLTVQVQAGVVGAEVAGDLADLKPVRFGDVVVCIGPVEGIWPTDLELLAQLFESPALPASPAVAEGPPRKTTAYALCGGAAAVIAFCLVAVIVQARPRSPMQAANGIASASRNMQQAIDRAGVRGLQVRNDASAISIEGMVETREQSHIALSTISALSLGIDIRPRFAVVEEVVESIRSSVGLPQALITHLGSGVFSFQVESADPDGTRAAISRVAADLAPSVQRIELVVTQSKATHRNTRVTSSFSDGDVSIVQTKDGAKYFGLTPTEIATPPRAEAIVPAKN